MSDAALSATHPESPAAPEILALAGDVGRPRKPFPFSSDLRHLPGESGAWAGLKAVVGMTRRGEDFFTPLARRYGSVFRYMLGPSPILCVADPDLIWSVVRNESSAWSTALPWTYYFAGLMPGQTGDSPLMLDFEPHRDARKLLQPAFSGPAIAGYLEAAQRIYEPLIAEWIARGRVKLKPAVRRLFAMVSARIFMGVDDSEEATFLDRAMTDGWDGVLSWRKRSRLSPSWRRAERGLGRLWSTLRPRMSEARTGNDLLTRICQTRDQADWLDDDTRMRLFISTMFGAFDTTAAGAAGMAALLARHPDWQDRLGVEAGTHGAATVEELKQLTELEWVWKETLRLYPVAGQLSRQSLRAVTLGAHRVPAGALVFLMVGTVARDPAYWSEPERFDPERFSPARAEDKRHKATYLPFGAGAHACIGAQIANVEIKAFFHALMRQARLRLVRDEPIRHTYTPIGMVAGDVELIVERV